jgi:ATP-dependent DNA ligase
MDIACSGEHLVWTTRCAPRTSAGWVLTTTACQISRSCIRKLTTILLSCTFDLLQLNGDDLRNEPLEVRKATLQSLLRNAKPGVRYTEHLNGDGEIIFKHACKLGLEGIVSKRRDFPYRSGRTTSWLKIKNPASAAMLRIAKFSGTKPD